MVRADCL